MSDTATQDTRPQLERIINRNVWINTPETASYEWRIVRADGSVLDEFDPDGVEGEGVLHFIKEWPGKPDHEMLTVGTIDALQPDGSTAKKEVTFGVWTETEPFEAYELQAIPRTLEHQSLKPLSVKIEPGMSPVWGHRNRVVAHSGGQKVVTAREETMFFGRRLADGTEEVTLVYPDGEIYEHTSFFDAIGHVHAPTHPKGEEVAEEKPAQA